MTLLRLASASEGHAILAAEDDFTRALGSFDRSFRMRTTAPVSDAELRRYLGEQAVDFTAEEAAAWEEAITAVAQGARGIGGVLPQEVLVVKTTGREERDHAHTRANAIVLPTSRVQSLRGDRALRLLAHELFHVASRASPALRDETYALLGFVPVGPVPPPPELDGSRMTNPDTHGLGHYLRLGERFVVPLRWIAFGHVESDECGAMNELLAAAPQAQVAHGAIGCMVSLDDLCDRPPRKLVDGEVIDLGGRRVRHIDTPHVPHNWEARVLYEETTRTLFCGDLFTHTGDGPALTTDDIVGPALAAEEKFHATALSVATAPTIRRLAGLEPRTLAVMHGSSTQTRCSESLVRLADAYEMKLAR